MMGQQDAGPFLRYVLTTCTYSERSAARPKREKKGPETRAEDRARAKALRPVPVLRDAMQNGHALVDKLLQPDLRFRPLP